MSHNLQHNNIILGIETSCDETALAIYCDAGLMGDVVYSQIDSHQVYGGVVPELAAREHLIKLDLLLNKLLNDTSISITEITHIAYTKGPGLIGALLVGANFAAGLAKGLGVPLIGVNHLEAHIVSPFINKDFPSSPFLTLLVSGGHTQIIYTESFGHYTILGESLDDACGEAFDKTAKIMGLDYPGGPIIEKLAKTADETIPLPRPMSKSNDAMMSFSGLKTATRTAYTKSKQEPNITANIAHSLQEAIKDTLLQKLNHAITKTGCDHLVVSGGVSANQALRDGFLTLPLEKIDFPPMKYCTDNAAMVAYLGYLRRNESQSGNLAQARWRIDEV